MLFYSTQLPRNEPVMHPKWSLYAAKGRWQSRPHHTSNTVLSHRNGQRKYYSYYVTVPPCQITRNPAFERL